jgi:hypothetical protein
MDKQAAQATQTQQQDTTDHACEQARDAAPMCWGTSKPVSYGRDTIIIRTVSRDIMHERIRLWYRICREHSPCAAPSDRANVRPDGGTVPYSPTRFF